MKAQPAYASGICIVDHKCVDIVEHQTVDAHLVALGLWVANGAL